MRPARARRPARKDSAREPDSAEAAYVDAIKRLARQAQSRATLADRLRRLGYAPPAVRAALDRAQENGYLNDREYADALVRRRAASRGHALIAQELRAKGIEDWAAEPALAQVDPEAEFERALTIGRSLLSHRRPADAEALLNSIAPRLLRRGFGSGLVYRVCRMLSDEWQAAGRSVPDQAFDSV